MGVAVIITFICCIFHRKLRRSHNGKLLLNLCFAYLGLNFSFILAVHISQHVYVLCILTSAALHYFLLASFLAMASEATVLYLELVRIFSTGKDGLPLKAAISTWSKQNINSYTQHTAILCMLTLRMHGFNTELLLSLVHTQV